MAFSSTPTSVSPKEPCLTPTAGAHKFYGKQLPVTPRTVSRKSWITITVTADENTSPSTPTRAVAPVILPIKKPAAGKKLSENQVVKRTSWKWIRPTLHPQHHQL